jgi:hypothetical protein
MKPPLGSFTEPTQRFHHWHMDIVEMRDPDNGYKYILTAIDRFTRWPEAYPLKNITAESCARKLLTELVPRFGPPLILTTDKGGQFKSQLFTEVAQILGIALANTTSYHPHSNGMVERFHRTLKASLKAACLNDPTKWISKLPFTLLHLRSAQKSNDNYSPAEYTYGENLRLPHDLITPLAHDATQYLSHTKFSNALIADLQAIAHNPPSYSTPKIWFPEALHLATQAFIRDETALGLRPPYTGPYQIVNKPNDQFYTLLVKNKEVNISTHRLKPFSQALNERELSTSSLTL